MMNKLKEFAIYYVHESNNTPENKSILYKYVKESTNEKIVDLLITGEMNKKSSIEEKKLFLSEFDFGGGSLPNISFGDLRLPGGNFVGAHISDDEAKVAAAGAVVAGGALVALLFRKAAHYYKDNFTKIGKICSHIKHGHEQRKICEENARKQLIKNQIAILEKGKAMCVKTKDKAQCVAKINIKIQKLKNKLG